MSLPRYAPTRFLEAGDREIKGCFSQASLGLEAAYKDAAGGWKVSPFALLPNESVTPCQVNIVTAPHDYDVGTSGVNETEYVLEFTFNFPLELMKFSVGVGANTYLDHVCAFRDWLAKGGTWAERLGRNLPGSPIEDPDAEGVMLGRLTSYRYTDPVALNNAVGIVVPVYAVYTTREDIHGVKR